MCPAATRPSVTLRTLPRVISFCPAGSGLRSSGPSAADSHGQQKGPGVSLPRAFLSYLSTHPQVSLPRRGDSGKSPYAPSRIPTSKPSCAPTTGAFTLLEYADDQDLPLVYVDTTETGIYMEEAGQVSAYKQVFDHVSMDALSRRRLCNS